MAMKDFDPKWKNLPGPPHPAVLLRPPEGLWELDAAEADCPCVTRPSAELHLGHRIGCEGPLTPPRSTLRFLLIGRHESQGMPGLLTGAEVHLRGAGHSGWAPPGLRPDCVPFHEVHVQKPILMHQG